MAAQQPTQEEMQAYLEQMREAEPAEIIAQAFQILAMGAEVKVGRPDARLLIDGLAAMVDAVGARVPGQLAEGMRGAVAQLQSMHVQAERQNATGDSADDPSVSAGTPTGGADEGRAAARGGQGQAAQASGQDQAGQASGQGQAGQGQAGQRQGGGGGQSMTDRLWVPGR